MYTFVTKKHKRMTDLFKLWFEKPYNLKAKVSPNSSQNKTNKFCFM